MVTTKAIEKELWAKQLWDSLEINEVALGAVDSREATLQYIENVLLPTYPEDVSLPLYSTEMCWQAARMAAQGFFWGYREALLALRLTKTVNR